MRIYVAGHLGLVGSAIVRAIDAGEEHTWIGQTRQELDLLDRGEVFAYVKNEKPDWVIIAAAKVGGIHANATYPVEFLSENLQIETNLIDACHAAKIARVLFLGSSCIYPKNCPQPIKEDYLLTGPLEPTNEAYALAKITGLKLIEAYRTEYGYNWISAMPTNLYGPGDNFDPENSHVLPGIIRKIHTAKISQKESVTLWGNGSPLREFLHADDLANACLHLLENYDGGVAINIGSGEELSISALAKKISRITGYKGEIRWDSSKPNGTPRKILDSTLVNDTGWRASIGLEKGLRDVYLWFLENVEIGGSAN
jgi:GDP-L-fucose synthase